ncbi:MAG: short-chain dehydrogenase [Acidimicrobiales bacterium]|nr:short-chain dehydrogenase [Acidimicrobiales bacterium]
MSGASEQVAIVAGGASGLGEAIAHGLAARGDRVLVADIDGEGAARVAKSIGDTAEAHEADIRVDRDVERLIAAAADAGGLHSLVLSAAVETRASIVDCTDDDWQRVVDTNLKGAFLCLRRGIPLMVASGGGGVVALGSVLGSIVAPQYAAYCASKTALVNLCKQAAIEHAPDGVRVNVVSPSACEAGLFMQVTSMAPDPDAVRRMVASNTPMKRLGTAADVVNAVLFLTSEQSSYISGAVIPLDGGMAARRS